MGAIPTSGVSSQCPDTEIQLLCNLIKNVYFSVRQLPLAHQLSYKQNFWIPVSSTGMTPFAVQFTFKNECSYSYVSEHWDDILPGGLKLQCSCSTHWNDRALRNPM
ncbi:hypothetical protein HCR18_06805 [Wolbachia pipientis]|nr:hypothetical protein [Wolbachia pipientis]